MSSLIYAADTTEGKCTAPPDPVIPVQINTTQSVLANPTTIVAGSTTAQAVDTTLSGTITLKWKTESEMDNYGFNLYRSLTKDGPWEKVNEVVVPGHGTTSEPHDYRLVDKGVKKNIQYYYKLEEIDLSGSPKQLAIIKGKDTKPVTSKDKKDTKEPKEKDTPKSSPNEKEAPAPKADK
jgi:hypothetical protein